VFLPRARYQKPVSRAGSGRVSLKPLGPLGWRQVPVEKLRVPIEIIVPETKSYFVSGPTRDASLSQEGFAGLGVVRVRFVTSRGTSQTWALESLQSSPPQAAGTWVSPSASGSGPA